MWQISRVCARNNKIEQWLRHVNTKCTVCGCAADREQYNPAIESNTPLLTKVKLGSALQKLSESKAISEHSVAVCRVILNKIKGLTFKITNEYLPLHALCNAAVHTESTEKMCALLLEQCPEWTSHKNEEGWLPLHLLCDCTCHQGDTVALAPRRTDLKE